MPMSVLCVAQPVWRSVGALFPMSVSLLHMSSHSNSQQVIREHPYLLEGICVASHLDLRVHLWRKMKMMMKLGTGSSVICFLEA